MADMRCVEYSSNNSGGSYWLSDDDWKNLEAAGWEVDWAKDDEWKLKWNSVDADGRYMGSLATNARRFGLKEWEAIEEFNRVTNQYADDEGCECCGPPHSFYESHAEPRTTPPLKVQAERVEQAPAKVNVITKSVRSRRVTRDNLIEGGHEFEEKTEGSKTTFVVTVPAGYEFSIVVPE